MTFALTLVLSLLSWLAYIALWRLHYSPIAKFPGPKLVALTQGYELWYDIVKGGKYVFKIRELHTRYGQ